MAEINGFTEANPHELNTDPNRVLFAYVEHVHLSSNVKYAGVEHALTQIHFTASYGVPKQHESVSFSQALLHHAKRSKFIAALLPGPWNPSVVAKQIASPDNYTNGHIACYRRSNESIRSLKGIWTAGEEGFSFEIFQGGSSDDARNNGAEVSDWYFMNGNDLYGFRDQIQDVKARAKKIRRENKVRFAVNGFVLVRDTEEDAGHVLQEIQGKADQEAVDAFRDAVQQAGVSTSNKTGMWADSKFEDLVQYNDGFKTKLIGTKEQIADRILLLKALGVNLVLTAFLPYDEEIERFGKDVLPWVRKLEGGGRGRNVEDESNRTGDVYRKKIGN
ncbi:putative Alkanesulfonate monooxygenase [Lophiotrema nucula]|uniref:Putative Alkanesulfonate monooxygenase n=1 Tax=Lophiotrema nucula TaxID=690887 RepID=A0A6A5Z1L7_9PLEO|nr:putative Alkanesulfonate monooxygenase [Lophiotrema nucula]